MPATVIDRILRWRKAWIGEGAHSDSHRRLFVIFFGVEHGCPADRAEPELELGSLITNANVLGCGAKDPIGCGEAGQCGKDTARPTLTGEAVANADSKSVHPELQYAIARRNKRLFETALCTSWDVVREPPRGSLEAFWPSYVCRCGDIGQPSQ
jgi:hypothetical protein